MKDHNHTIQTQTWNNFLFITCLSFLVSSTPTHFNAEHGDEVLGRSLTLGQITHARWGEEEVRKGREFTHHDFVLPCEVGRLTEELCLGHGDSTRGLPNQHCVVEFGASRCGRAEVFAL